MYIYIYIYVYVYVYIYIYMATYLYYVNESSGYEFSVINLPRSESPWTENVSRGKYVPR